MTEATAVADAELGLLAGGDRIEGTLFGNGERTGNVDIVTLAMNMFCHGVDPELDLLQYAGGSRNIRTVYRYESAILASRTAGSWYSPHSPDPIRTLSPRACDGIKRKDLTDVVGSVSAASIRRTSGREYEADVIRINSQSGKGGIAYILEQNFGYSISAADARRDRLHGEGYFRQGA